MQMDCRKSNPKYGKRWAINNMMMMMSGHLIRIGSLSTHVSETWTATGSELFSLLTCPHTTTFTLLSIFSLLEISSIKSWETTRSGHTKCSLPVTVCVSKTRVLKLPNKGNPKTPNPESGITGHCFTNTECKNYPKHS